MSTSSNRVFIEKGWGYEEILCNSEKYCSKILHMNKSKKLSYHYHNIKDETFYVENGRIILTYGETDDISLSKSIILNPGDTFHIPTGLRHRITGLENSRIFEFSTQHFDEDSIRVIKGD
jgi:mannose-6-phosphate isomerase-like protein (cupin superfamily)